MICTHRAGPCDHRWRRSGPPARPPGTGCPWPCEPASWRWFGPRWSDPSHRPRPSAPGVTSCNPDRPDPGAVAAGGSGSGGHFSGLALAIPLHSKEGFPAYLLDLSRRQSPSLDESGRDGFDEEPIHRRGDERLGFLDLVVKILLNHLGRAVEIVSQFARGNRSPVEGDKGTEHIGPRTYVLDASVDPTEAQGRSPMRRSITPTRATVNDLGLMNT